MNSYEEKIKSEYRDNLGSKDKINISVLKYFWQRGLLSGQNKELVPNFLRHIDILSNFSENELHIFINQIHQRNFSSGDIIFKQNDVGFGMYFILKGNVNILINKVNNLKVKRRDIHDISHDISHDINNNSDDFSRNEKHLIVSLEKSDYFGELALLKENSLRSATAIAKDSCILLGIFRPDVEELVDRYPVIAAKLLQSICQIVANRHVAITSEIQVLKQKVYQLEKDAKNKE